MWHRQIKLQFDFPRKFWGWWPLVFWVLAALGVLLYSSQLLSLGMTHIQDRSSKPFTIESSLTSESKSDSVKNGKLSMNGGAEIWPGRIEQRLITCRATSKLYKIKYCTYTTVSILKTEIM